MKKSMLIAAVLCVTLMASACGQQYTAGQETETILLEETLVSTAEETETPTAESAETETASETESRPASSENTDDEIVFEDNFEADLEIVMEYARKIKTAVADQDIQALADLTGFPVYVGLESLEDPVIKSKEDFIALGAETVITAEMAASIAAADENALSPSMAGFTLMDGEGPSITFGVVEGKLAITGINY